MRAAYWAVVAVLFLFSDARWLRTAQREHYRPGRVARMASMWCRVRPVNAVLLAVACALALVGLKVGWLLWFTLAFAAWPLGMSVRARSAPLRFTPRLRRLTVLLVLAEIGLCLAVRSPHVAAVVAMMVPLVVDLCLAIMQPIEHRLGTKFVKDARKRLSSMKPRVVAITGSYGKTSTKLYTAHILARYRSVLASPASFNNLMGLSMTINQRLSPGTEFFIAEMGTYGPGEIRALCQAFPPDIAAITTIGEAHLERMKDRATIVAAKSEITERAGTVVLNVDVPELAELAHRLSSTKQVVRCSTKAVEDGNVAVIPHGSSWMVSIDGDRIADIAAPDTAHPVNLAIAVGIACAAGIGPELIAKALDGLPGAPHRAELTRLPNGPTVIDDTYNANPEGALRALEAARKHVAPSGTIWTITPGMVELGSEQLARNRTFAQAATAEKNMMLIITGRTNRAGLLSGASSARQTRVYPNRARAATAVLAEAGLGDVIIYENDLPDHYP